MVADIENLQAGGVDAIMFGNENDRPYVFKAPPEGVAAMTAVVEAVEAASQGPLRRQLSLGPGRQRRDRRARPARSFVREIFTGLFASDMGLWRPDAAGALRLRRNLGRDDMKLLFNINAEFAHSLDERPIALRAKSAVFSSLADAILVSGPLTGEPVDRSDLTQRARGRPERRRSSPTPASTSTMSAKSSRSPTACVIGTHFKVDGNTWNPVDGEAREAVHGRRGEASVTASRSDVSFPRMRESRASRRHPSRVSDTRIARV